VVGCGCVELGCELCALRGGYCIRTAGVGLRAVCTVHDAAPQDHSQPQPTQPVQNTTCSRTRSYSPDDGHNDARNMLR